MNIHEYQAKAVLREFGVPVPRGHAAFSVEDAVKAAKDLGTPVLVVKAQIHAGGRGKAGGVKVVKGGPTEAQIAAWRILAQVAGSKFNFGEVGICQFKMLSIQGILVFKPPQLCDRWTTSRRPARPRIAPQVSTCVRMVAGSR